MSVRKAKDVDNSGVIMLMLGLYLILLAFFILLNAISEISVERFQKAQSSIASGFGFQPIQFAPEQQELDPTITQTYEAISADIRRMLESYVTFEDFNVEQIDVGQMVVRLQPRAFFAENSWQLKQDQVGFFQNMAELMNMNRNGIVLHADVVVNTGKRPATTEQVEVAGRRASMFVRALTERNIPSNRLSAEVREIAEPQILLLFNAKMEGGE